MLSVGETTCPYCLTRFRLPPDMAAPIAAHASLGQQLDTAREQLAAERQRAKGPPWLLIAMGTAFVVVGATGAAAPVGFALSQPSLDSGLMLSVGLMLIAYGGLGMGVAVGVIRGMRNARLRLAANPFADVHATDRLSLTCPFCGAGLTAGGDDVVTRCGHCRAASLLPAAFVPRQLQRKHARILAIRERFSDTREIAASITHTVNESMGWAMVTIGVLGFLLFAFAAMQPDFAPHLSGVERIMAVLCSGGLVLGIFGGGGVMALRNAKRRGSQPHR